MNKSSARGRRTGNPDTREQILEAARSRFLADGYQATTMRSVATDAGVDVALVSYYFGSKQGIFGAAMALPVNPGEVVAPLLEGDLGTLAERLLTALLTVWDNPVTGGPLQEMARTATVEPDLNRVVREAVGREIIDKLAARIGGPDADQRAGAFSAQMAGVIFSRYILRLEPIASMSVEDVVRRLAPSFALTIAAGPGPVRRRAASASSRKSSHR
jgi:AcrR family transcriptional regulator